VEDEDLNERVAEAEADESLFWRIFQKREAELLAICRMIDNEYHHLSEHLPRVDPKDQWSADQTEEFARNLSTPTHRDHAGDGAEPVAHP